MIRHPWLACCVALDLILYSSWNTERGQGRQSWTIGLWITLSAVLLYYFSVFLKKLTTSCCHPDNRTALSTGYNHHSGSWSCASGNAGHWGRVGKKALKFVCLWRFILNAVSHCCKLWHLSSLTLQWGMSKGEKNRAWPQNNIRCTIKLDLQ